VHWCVPGAQTGAGAITGAGFEQPASHQKASTPGAKSATELSVTVKINKTTKNVLFILMNPLQPMSILRVTNTYTFL